MRRAAIALAAWVMAIPVAAQESQFHADLRREAEHVAASCGDFSLKAVGNCAYTLATDSPFHVAFGSLAPQNGFGFGAAFTEHYTPNESWRLSWNADGVGAASGAWRAGLYMKIVHTPATSGVVVRPAGSSGASPTIAPREFAVVDVYAQAMSLNTIGYFGAVSPNTETLHAVYGQSQTIVGTSVTYPLGSIRAISGLRMALLGGVNGRFVSIRPGPSDQGIPITPAFTNDSAPGLTAQDPFVEFREGLRFRPALANGWLRLDYLVSAQQFRTSTESRSSFDRWTIDLKHEIPIYRHVSSTGPREFNGPDECRQAVGSPGCPPVQWSRNREGAVGFRLLVSSATASEGSQVPFYFQRTLGGSDIDGEMLLASYEDYRFRGPKLLALQERFEHSIWGPFGAYVLAEQGKVALAGEDLGFGDLTTSTTIGLTLRAGGLPMVNLSFSWGGGGHHVIGAMSPTLLGGSSRPSSF
jgi:hypothetical protein